MPGRPQQLPYAEHYDVRKLVRQVAEARAEGPLDTRNISFHLSKADLMVGDRPGMVRWRKRLFLATSLIAADPADYLRLPRKRTVTLGAEIEF